MELTWHLTLLVLSGLLVILVVLLIAVSMCFYSIFCKQISANDLEAPASAPEQPSAPAFEEVGLPSAPIAFISSDLASKSNCLKSPVYAPSAHQLQHALSSLQTRSSSTLYLPE